MFEVGFVNAAGEFIVKMGGFKTRLDAERWRTQYYVRLRYPGALEIREKLA